MAPDAEACASAQLNVDAVHQGGRRILPDEQPPAQAWVENEDDKPRESNSPAENRRLLPADSTKKTLLQSGVTLSVHAHSKYTKFPQFAKPLKKETNFQKRRDKIIAWIKPPYFILAIIIITVCVYEWGTENLQSLLEWSPDVWRGEPWRLFTYSFIHAGTLHVALNAVMALAVGWPLEREQGAWRVLALWGGGVAAGALGAGALQPHVHVVGASAAVYALLTAHLPNVCLRFGHIPLWWFRPLSVLVLAASEGGWSLMHTSPSWQTPSPANARAVPYEHVAWSAHVLGAAVGIPLAFLVFTGENKNHRYVIRCRVVSFFVLVFGCIVASVYYGGWYDLDQT